MSNKEKLKIMLEIVTLPFVLIWAFIDGFLFVPGRIDSALRKANEIYRKS